MISTPANMDFSNPRLELHMRFICPECGEEHQSQQAWRRHLNDAHDYLRKNYKDLNFREINERYHECNVCKKRVANANQTIALLQYHRFMHLPYSRTYRCRHCTGAFTRKRALCEHIYRFHGRLLIMEEKKHRLEVISDTAVLKASRKNAEFYLRCLCPQCGKGFEFFQQWVQHINSAHHVTSRDLKMHRISGTKNNYCLECKRLLFTSEKAKLQRHSFTHLPHKAYFQCAYCSLKKEYKSEILMHFINSHRMEFEANKAYIKKPIEWGCSPNEYVCSELESMFNSNGKKSRQIEKSNENSKKTDLIQKALMDSLIDLEKESADELKQHGRNANEYALDQSLNDLKAILSDDFPEQIHTQEAPDVQELEELCMEMFEEIEKEHLNVPMPEVEIKTEIKEEIDVDQSEQIISIEINPLNDSDESFKSPMSKRLKFSGPVDKDDKVDKKQTTKSLYEAHIHYLCPECGKEFDKQPTWRQHVFSEHNVANALEDNFKLLEDQASYLCLTCLSVQHTSKESDLQRHHFMHMPYQSYLKCTLCSKTKSSKPKMLQHLQDFHPVKEERKPLTNVIIEPRFRCVDCQRGFQTQTRWQNHRAQCAQRTVIRNYSIGDNLKLIVHLKAAYGRMQKLKANIPSKRSQIALS